jgi:hypothetical protein
VLKCFSARRELRVDSELADRVPEGEWLRRMESSQMTQLRALLWQHHICYEHCDYLRYSDRWVAALCTQLPRLTRLELTLQPRMTNETLSILADAPALLQQLDCQRGAAAASFTAAERAPMLSAPP